MKKPITLIDVTRWFVITVGVLFYLIFVAIGVIELNQDPLASQPFLHKLGVTVEFILLGSGLPPLMITVYFLGVRKTGKAWLVGAILLPMFLVAHYVTVVFMAHAPTTVHLPMILAELVAAIAAIWLWERKARRSNLDPPQPARAN